MQSSHFRFFFVFSLICFGAVGFALFSQHVWNMQPCPWCILQRIIYILMGFGSLVFAFAIPSGRAWSKRAIVGASFLSLLCLTGIGLVIYQHFIAAAQSSCTFSKAEKLVIWSQLDQLLPSVFQVTASCADAALAKLLGVPYELASGMLFLGLLAYCLINLRQFIFKVH